VVLGLLQASHSVRNWSPLQPLQRLGQMSYSVFLVHFPVCLLVNAAFSQVWPTQPWVNAFGMLLAFGLSMLGGRGLYRYVETRLVCMPSALRLQGGLLAAGLLLAGIKAL
jgi:peptidoglycan/LPS O-acetylase OafA/YrhL